MTWEVGVATGCCTERPILDALEMAARANVEALEIGTPPRHFNPFEPGEVDEVAEALQRLSLHPRSIHAPFGGTLDLSDPDDHRRGEVVAAMRRVARVLKRFGGTVVVVHPSDVPRHATDPWLRLRACAEALQHLGRDCREIGVTLAVETPLPHLVGGHPDEFSWLLGQLDEGIGVCLDTGHVHLGHHLKAMLGIIGRRLVHVHAHDNRGTYDDHLAPGRGTIGWAEVFSGLAAARYGGTLILELHCPESGRCTHYGEAVAAMQRLLAAHGFSPQGHDAL